MRFFKDLFAPLFRPLTCGQLSILTLALLIVLLSFIPNYPCGGRWRGQATRALGDISAVETALTEILADAQLSRLEQLFNPDGVREVAMKHFGATTWPPLNAADFKAATMLYTHTLYAILRSGRDALDATDSTIEYRYDEVLNPKSGMKLGRGYLSDLELDPWENLYNIYPGPWDAKGKDGSLLTIPFRIYCMTEIERNLPGASTPPEPDELTVHIDGDLDGKLDGPNDYLAGYPARTDEIAYIWSNGLNLVSGQALYNAAGYDNVERYDLNQEPELIAGGDDINNWDPWNSWNRLY